MRFDNIQRMSNQTVLPTVKAFKDPFSKKLWLWECSVCQNEDYNELADGDFSWRGSFEESKTRCAHCQVQVLVRKPS
jgi:hypothetical protein